MPGSILGTRVLRTEDPALLTGSARYLNDLDLPGKLHAVFARSEVAHARLGTVHIDDAEAVPGVVAVYTAETLGVAPHHGFVTVHPDFARPPLATGVVRFVGEAIAVVVAESVVAAADGAAAVWADYEPLDPIVDAEDAFADGRAGDLPRPRQQPGARRHRPAARPGVDQRRRRARPLRQPARRRRADGDQRLRRRARRGRAADVLRVDADAARPARPARQGAGAATAPTSA